MSGFETLFAGLGGAAGGGAAAGAGTAAAAGAGTAAAAGAGTAAAAGAGAAGAAGASGWGLGTYLSAAGTALSTISAIQQGGAAENAAKFNAEQARIEADSKARAVRELGMRRLGSIRAQIGKSGATSAGTPLMILAESAANSEIDALNTEYGGQLQSSIYGMQGRQARRQGNLMAGTSLLSGYGRIR